MINLLPPAVKQQNQFARWNVSLLQYTFLTVAISISLVGVLIFGVVIVSRDESSLQKAIDTKQQTLDQLQPEFNQAKLLANRVNTVKALFDKNIEFSKLLQNIGALIPDGASLTGLSLTGNDQRPLQIQAKVKTQDLAAVLRENLEASDIFSLADIQVINVGDTKGSVPLNYVVTIVAQFAPPTETQP